MALLELQVNNCKDSISENSRLIKKNEDLYDSLKQFKRKVSDAQGNFMEVVSDKKRKLPDMEVEFKNCRTADKYSEGMLKVLNKVGVQCVNLTYSALLLSINMKLAEYENEIDRCEMSNQRLRQSIDELNLKIEKEKANSDE